MTAKTFAIAAVAGLLAMPVFASANTILLPGTHLTGATETETQVPVAGTPVASSSTVTAGTHETGATEGFVLTLPAANQPLTVSSVATAGTHETGATETIMQTL